MSDAPTTLAGLKDDRPRFTFPIPESDRLYSTDPKSVTMVPLRISQEQDALKASRAATGSESGYLNEALRRCVVAIDGKPVNWNEGGAEWLEKCSPKVRSRLRTTAFDHIHMPDPAADADFLAQVQVEMP